MTNWKWPMAVILLIAGILFVGHYSHNQFRSAITSSFNDQQDLFARSMEFAIQDHLLEEEQDLRSTISILDSSGRPKRDIEEIFESLYETHLDDFSSVSVHTVSGELVAWISAGTDADHELLDFITKTISRRKRPYRAYISEPYTSAYADNVVYLCVPFTIPGSDKGLVAVAGIKLGEYLSLHFPAWRGRHMGFMLTDDDGDILALMNTSHDLDQKMYPGNIFNLSSDCLKCHGKGDFSDVWEALQRENIVHSPFSPPGGGLVKNRTTIPFEVFNETWSITVMSPFESIQRSITRNLVVNLLLTAFALVLVAGVSYYFLKASSYEKLASAAEALSRSEEKLKANARRLEEANRLKDLFTDIVRHDLMSAVAAVKGYSGILAEGEADRSRKELFSSMEGSLLKLRDLIESAATISKIQEGAFETKELDAAAMLGRAMDRVVPAADERGVSLDVSAPGELVFEASPLLEEVFVNILSNAVKYSPEGGTVNVMLRGGGDGLVIIVSDRGEGIPDEHKERVFERLERLDKSGIKGSGLGLAIVRRIVRLHGGTVAVTDNPGGGAVFTVRIPPGEEGLAPALRLTERDQGRGSGTK